MSNGTDASTTPRLGQTAVTCLAGVATIFLGLIAMPVPASGAMLLLPFIAGAAVVLAVDAMVSRSPRITAATTAAPARVEPEIAMPAAAE